MGYVRYNEEVEGEEEENKKGKRDRLTIRRVHTISTVQLQNYGFHTFAGIDDDLGDGRRGSGKPAESQGDFVGKV